MREALAAAFRRNFAERGEIGAAVAVWKDGVEATSLCGGRAARAESTASWRPDTLVPVWSASKGPAAATLLWALDRSGVSLEAPVRSIWPKLAADVTFAQLLSHQSGLAALDAEVPVFDREAIVAALERQAPQWPPGTAHGYHPRTIGTLWDECVRRLCSGTSLGDLWRTAIAEPLGLEVWIGLPAAHHPRVAAVFPGPGRPRPEEAGFARAFRDRSSLTFRAFHSPRGLERIGDMNASAVWSAGFPGFGGVASAAGLAKFYGILATGGGGVLSLNSLRAMETELVSGPDRILQMPTTFSAGFQKDPIGLDGKKIRSHYGPSLRAFGHPGAGGSLAFADPEHRLGFAYVMNLIEPGVMPNERALSLVEALYAAPAQNR